MRRFRRTHTARTNGPPGTKSLPDSARSFGSTIETIRSARSGRGLVAEFRGSQELYLGLIAWLALADAEASGTDAIIALFRTLDRLGAPALGPGRVYNETIVMFWIVVARRRMPAEITATPNEKAAAARAFARAYAKRHRLIYEFYRRSLVHSWKARVSWVEPDLKPIEALDRHEENDAGEHRSVPNA